MTADENSWSGSFRRPVEVALGSIARMRQSLVQLPDFSLHAGEFTRLESALVVAGFRPVEREALPTVRDDGMETSELKTVVRRALEETYARRFRSSSRRP